MRKRRIALLCAFSLLIGSCVTPMENSVQAGAKKPSLNKRKATVKAGKTVRISVKWAKGFKITWKSKNKKIATVKKSGTYAAKVTGKKTGKAKIVATVKKGKTRYSLKCQITVTKKKSVTPEKTPDVVVVMPALSENVPAASPSNKTAAPSADGTAVPTLKPTSLPKPELQPSETIENGEMMVLSADTLLDSAAKSITYNKDGSVTVSLTTGAGGGGICFYIDPQKGIVDLNNYTSVIFDVTAEANEPVVLNEYSETNIWKADKTISYTNVTTERTLLSAELSNDRMLGLGIRYAAWNEVTADPLVLTIHSITLVKDVRDTADALTNYSPLFEMAADYGFKMGTVFNANTATNRKYGELMKYHFNSIAAANEMKAYSMLDGTRSKANYTDKDSMPVLNFTNADVVMDYAKNSGMQVRGHVLVWDADMSDWFFREEYDTSKPYASEEVVTARLKNYIEQVLVHFEEKYPGVIYCWDVVNEAVEDGTGGHVVGDPRMVRTTRGRESNCFYERLGDHYVEKTFQYTYEAVQKYKDLYPSLENIKMYYNDYNTFYATKRGAICELVKSINSTLPDGKGGYVKLCDGVGMQGYIGGWYSGDVNNAQNGCMQDSDIELVKTAIEKFADLGVEVQMTELAVRNFLDDEETMERHGAFYKKLFQTYIDINKTRTDKPLKAVSIWGIVDNPDMKPGDYGYIMNGPYCGLFDETLAVKPAFQQVHDLLKNGN